MSAAFSPDGKRFFTASRDDTSRLWDAETGRPIGVLFESRHLLSAAFDPRRQAHRDRVGQRDGAAVGRHDRAADRRADARQRG